MLRKLFLGAALLVSVAAFSRDFNPKKVVANLAVISDTHVNGYQTVPAYKFRSALIQERDYAEKFGGLDAVVVVGDLVDSPAWNAKKYTEIDDWKRLYESVFDPKEMPMVYTVGNHDIWKEWTENTYKEAKQFPNRLGPDYYLTEVGDPEMAEKFKAITEADPDKYVIVITHAMIYHTIYGSYLDDSYPKHSGYWSTRVLTDVLNKYPQVVSISGHVHGSLASERQIWQGEFTSVSIGWITSEL